MAGTPRAVAREQMNAAILDIGRKQLAEVGPAALSLRAVAREIGVASSAVYRYVESRDELLTRLIVAGYNALGDAVEAAEGSRRRTDLRGRWRTACSALRAWAKQNPHEWALIYGSPVPGYAAPEETIEPAARVAVVLLKIIADAGGESAEQSSEVRPVALRKQLEAMAELMESAVTPGQMAAATEAWTTLIGTISMELFGHYVGTVDPTDDYFTWQVDRLAVRLGI